MGENLFIAESEEQAWQMMMQSPSHLYNFVYPHFKKILIRTKPVGDGNKIRGSVIFGD